MQPVRGHELQSVSTLRHSVATAWLESGRRTRKR